MLVTANLLKSQDTTILQQVFGGTYISVYLVLYSPMRHVLVYLTLLHRPYIVHIMIIYLVGCPSTFGTVAGMGKRIILLHIHIHIAPMCAQTHGHTCTHISFARPKTYICTHTHTQMKKHVQQNTG